MRNKVGKIKKMYTNNGHGYTIAYRSGTRDLKIIKENHYQPFFNNIKSDDIILDVGGFIGSFSIRVGLLCKKLIVYEPDKDNFKYLNENVKFDNAILKNMAVVGNHDYHRMLFSNTTSPNKAIHSFYVVRGRNCKLVGCENINDIYRRFRFNKIKIDSEGCEYEIIKNFKHLNKIDDMIFEYHFAYLHDTGNHPKYRELINLLKKYFKNIKYKKKVGGDWGTVVRAWGRKN
jgi:FkbM family methyltransferase